MSNIKNIFKKSDDPNSVWNHMGQVLILTLAGSFIYFLPFFRFYFYDTFVEAFGISNTQMGLIGTVYGACGVVSYFIGGLLASKFSVRKLMVFSFIATGIGGLVLMTYPPFPVVIAVQIGWGFTSLMTFWPALVKALNMLGNENEKGKSFGFMEGGRGISNIIFMTIAVGIFDFFTKKMNAQAGLTSVMAFYSVLAFIMAIFIFFALKGIEEKSDGEEEKNNKLDVALLKQVLKNKYMWMMVTIMFCSYTMCIAYTYFNPYATSQFGSTVTFAAFITTFAQYTRPVACIGSGTLADKISSSRVFLIGFLMMIAGLIGVLVIPGQASMIPVFIIAVAACYIAMYATQSLHFTLFEEARFTPDVVALAIGIACTIGYLPEMIIPMIAGRLLDKYPGIVGYRYFFFVMLAFMVIGISVLFIWMVLTKERRMELIQMGKRKKAKKETA
ncbi:MAG: MFS transporter [Firmicutes bacterium]|nr:MFS transporter [Bacillota bacterium]